MEPQIRFCTSADGTRIACTTYGEPGLRPVVSVHFWPIVQNMSWRNPRERPFFEELAQDRSVVAFDRRGIGASQRDVQDVGLDAQLQDLSAVTNDAGMEVFDMIGFAEGAA